MRGEGQNVFVRDDQCVVCMWYSDLNQQQRGDHSEKWCEARDETDGMCSTEKKQFVSSYADIFSFHNM